MTKLNSTKRTEANRIVIYDYLYSVTVHKTNKEISSLRKEQKTLSKDNNDVNDVHYIWFTVCENILKQRENVAMYDIHETEIEE